MKFAVLGSPISHSKSPQIHLAAYKALGLNWSYDRHEVTEEHFADFLSQSSFNGFSLTMPLKEVAYELALEQRASIDDNATQLKAVNTLVFGDIGMQAFNTDVFGVTQTMLDAELADPSTLAILGSGATSRSVLLGLFKSFDSIGSITVFARNRDTAGDLINLAAGYKEKFDDIQWLPLEAAADFGGADLTCNTLPASVADSLEVDVPIQGGWLFDVGYNPWPSQLSKQWNAAQTISGAEMLLWQALAQVRIFVNGDPFAPIANEGHIFAEMRAAI